MRLPVHPESSWATSAGLDRLVLAGLGVLVVLVAATLGAAGYLPAACAVLGIAVLGVVAFACTAADIDPDLSFAIGSTPDDADPGR